MCLIMYTFSRLTPYQTLTTFTLAYSSIYDGGAEQLASALVNHQVDTGYLGCAFICVDLKCD